MQDILINEWLAARAAEAAVLTVWLGLGLLLLLAGVTLVLLNLRRGNEDLNVAAIWIAIAGLVIIATASLLYSTNHVARQAPHHHVRPPAAPATETRP